MSVMIDELVAREILDSRGNPTIEVDLNVSQGWYRASVPSGASTGSHEAWELRDEDPKRYLGKGVQTCIHNARKLIAPAIKGKKFESAQHLDHALIELDGTPNKSKLGANTILAISMAFHRACAASQSEPLFEFLHKTYFSQHQIIPPIPMMNVINGGQHADNPIQIQEFMICPHLDVQSSRIQDRIRAGAETYHHLKKLIQKAGYQSNVGDEGGFAPAMRSETEVLDLVNEAIQAAGYTVGKDISLALDVAATEFYEKEAYQIHLGETPLSSEALATFYLKLLDAYPSIISIEDPFAEDDWDGWSHFYALLKKKAPQLMLIGDDLLVTNAERVSRAIESQSCNAILVKINQIGSISEASDTMNHALAAGWKAIISHRSGETEDPFIAHLVTASGAGWIKTGAPCRTDRNAKYNELLRIFI